MGRGHTCRIRPGGCIKGRREMQDVIARLLLVPFIGYGHFVVPALLIAAMHSVNRTRHKKMQM